MKYEFDISIGIQDVLDADKATEISTCTKNIPEAILQDKLFELRIDARYSGNELCHNILNELSKWAEKYCDK